MKTKWMITLIGISATLSLLVTGCGGGEARTTQTPAAGGASGVVSTQSGSQTIGVKGTGNANITANESGITTSPTTATGLSADLERQIKEDYIKK